MRLYNVLSKKLITLLVLCFTSIALFSQNSILNEDFSSATGTTPPAGWTNNTVDGEAQDLWHFDNPGGRVVNYPATGTMAILDAANYSNDSMPEEVILESRYVECSGSNDILIMFHHWFVPNDSASVSVEVNNGINSGWVEVAQFTDSIGNVDYEVINVSSIIGGYSDARVRFIWKSNGRGWWAIDNFKVYAPLALDAALENISNPKMPFESGTHDIKVDVSNLGIDTITSLLLNWELNGVVQTSFNWTGSLPLGQVTKDVAIGFHNFVDGKKVNLRVWLSDPNGELDDNPQNNELQTNIYGSLNGTYTIGGTSPDFINFTEAVTVLNTAGIVGPVDFLVRDGYYDEQIVIGKINGSS
nr:hypothetical protein [Salinivirgaceae bacterium]